MTMLLKYPYNQVSFCCMGEVAPDNQVCSVQVLLLS
jgi:hypothetical protein